MSVLSYIALRMVTQAGLGTSEQIHAKYLSNELKTVESSILNDIEGTKKNKLKSRKERLNRTKKALKSFESNTEETDSKIDERVTYSYHEKLELAAAQIYTLCSHSQQRKGADYLKRIVMGMFLTECLKRSGYFKNCSEDNIRKGAYKKVDEVV